MLHHNFPIIKNIQADAKHLFCVFILIQQVSQIRMGSPYLRTQVDR